MHMANPTAITIVAKVLNGAGQHSGPQGVGGRVLLAVAENIHTIFKNWKGCGAF